MKIITTTPMTPSISTGEPTRTATARKAERRDTGRGMRMSMGGGPKRVKTRSVHPATSTTPRTRMKAPTLTATGTNTPMKRGMNALR